MASERNALHFLEKHSHGNRARRPSKPLDQVRTGGENPACFPTPSLCASIGKLVAGARLSPSAALNGGLSTFSGNPSPVAGAGMSSFGSLMGRRDGMWLPSGCNAGCAASCALTTRAGGKRQGATTGKAASGTSGGSGDPTGGSTAGGTVGSTCIEGGMGVMGRPVTVLVTAPDSRGLSGLDGVEFMAPDFIGACSATAKSLILPSNSKCCLSLAFSILESLSNTSWSIGDSASAGSMASEEAALSVCSSFTPSRTSGISPTVLMRCSPRFI
mmetsp:Transcript_65683/g.182084  ORF Transcript_65683/g.182084 Transcript_65683/m.182084 type:complete len:272 (+) Transcript_65683:88-903(+)